MPNSRYVNTFVRSTALVNNSGTQIGVLLSEYDVREYWDVRNAVPPNPGTGTPALAMRAYVVTLRQRLTIPNRNANSYHRLQQVDSYSNYPILAVQQVSPQPPAASANLAFYLEDYSPKTLNAMVNTSNNAGTSTNTGTSVARMSGSSTSVTNSYEVGGSAGFFGDLPTGSVSGGYSHSETDTTEHSVTKGKSSDVGAQAGTGNSMSIKDWASYAFLDPAKETPAWVWGQEYPWNVISFRSTDVNQNVALPGYVSSLLFDGKTVYPPSNISQFGINVVSHAKWVFYIQGQAGAQDETVAFQHTITYWEGSHLATTVNGNPQAQANIAIVYDQPVETVTLNLPVLALDPIADAGAGNGAVVGFAMSEFIALPGSAPFRIKSEANNLYVFGSGFDSVSTADSVLTASNLTASAPVSFTLQFKVVDASLELNLYFKHWLTMSTGCIMTIHVNGYKIVRHVDALDAGSGADNLTTVTLRKKDYTAPDFYDYLVIGLNEIVVTISPNTSDPCGYSLRALAIQ